MAVRRKTNTVSRRRGTATTAQAPQAVPPFSGAHFRVLIGATEVGFCHISRLQASGDEATVKTTQPAVTGPPSVVLRRAITQSKDLYLWRERVAAGKRDLRTVTIQQCDPTGRVVLNTWVLHGCRPVRWSGPEFNALGNDILWEELEICCARLEWL
jgi:phage tail-like protein